MVVRLQEETWRRLWSSLLLRARAALEVKPGHSGLYLVSSCKTTEDGDCVASRATCAWRALWWKRVFYSVSTSLVLIRLLPTIAPLWRAWLHLHGNLLASIGELLLCPLWACHRLNKPSSLNLSPRASALIPDHLRGCPFSSHMVTNIPLLLGNPKQDASFWMCSEVCEVGISFCDVL